MMNLIEAVKAGRTAAILFLVTQSNSRYEKEESLQYALEKKRLDIAKILIEAGVNANLTSITNQHTALHLAAQTNNITMVQYLLTRSYVYSSPKDKNGWTPLHYAANLNNNNSHLGTIKLLLEKGANVHAKNNEGRTPGEYLVKPETVDFNTEIFRLFSAYANKNVTQNLVSFDSYHPYDRFEDFDF